MSLFIDYLEDVSGAKYRYGHCYADDDNGGVYGCGMEYAYYEEDNYLQSWHDAVGMVSDWHGFTADDVAALETAHEEHMHNLSRTA